MPALSGAAETSLEAMRLSRILPLLRRQDGISLVMAVGVLGVLSFTGSTLVYYSNSNARSAEFSKDNGGAYDVAEAGMNEMMAILSKPQNNALKGNLLPQTARTYDGGTVTWSGTLDMATAVWSLTSTGRIKNPTGVGADVTRTLTAKVPVTATYTQPLNNPSWNYIYSKATGNTCDMLLTSNLQGSARLHVAGNLCLDSNAVYTASSLIVKGNLTLSSNGQIGYSTNMGTRVESYVGGNCKNNSTNGGAWATPCSGNQDSRKIYSKLADGTTVGVSNSPPVIAAPAADFANWYENAIPGPAQNCTTVSGTPPTFDNNYPNRNNSIPTVFELTPASSYTCRVGPAGSPSGELSWNASTKTLTVAGTIFIDGSVKATNDGLNQYNGQASLYLSGTFRISGSTKLCGGISGSACNFSAWNPNTEMLTIVANGNNGDAGSGNSVLVESNAQFQGGLFATNGIQFTSNARADGPMVASTVKFDSNVQFDQFPTITTVPVGMPGNPAVYAQPNPPQLYSG
jgi:hypothetical protein